jgi:hypothetical protein
MSQSLYPGSARLGANDICPHAEPYESKRSPERQDPYDAVSKARAERTLRFWEYTFQKGRSCRLASVFCSEYDLPDWQKCPILKRVKMGSPGNASTEEGAS